MLCLHYQSPPSLGLCLVWGMMCGGVVFSGVVCGAAVFGVVVCGVVISAAVVCGSVISWDLGQKVL